MIQAATALQLRITIYDKANLPEGVRSEALDHLRRIFRAANTTVELVAGEAGTPEASTVVYEPRPIEGKQMEAACGARRDIALDLIPFSPSGLRPEILGLALPFAPTGLNVRVFHDRIQKVAANMGQPEAVVLAYAIAHEIGHVLLRSSLHMNRGLMAGVWTRREYDWMSTDSLLFTKEQSRTMLANLRGDRCPSSANVNGSPQRASSRSK